MIKFHRSSSLENFLREKVLQKSLSIHVYHSPLPLPPHTRNLQMVHRFSMMHDNVARVQWKMYRRTGEHRPHKSAGIERKTRFSIHPAELAHISWCYFAFVNGSVMNLEGAFFFLRNGKKIHDIIFSLDPGNRY